MITFLIVYIIFLVAFYIHNYFEIKRAKTVSNDDENF